MTRRLLIALIVALFFSLLVQWAIDHAVDRWLINTSRLPNLR